MKLSIRNISILALSAMAPVTAMAQNTRSGYFLEDYTYRFQMNPAMDNSRNFFAMPALGNVNVSMNGTLNVSDVIYNVNGRTTTFLNPGVSAQEVMKNIGDKNRIGADVKLTLLAAGFKAWGGYNTIAVNARVSTEAHLPGSFFSLLKEGVENKSYDISDLRAFGTGYAELSLGHSRQINKKWRVGASMKLLVGGGYVDAILDQAQLTLGENDWTIKSDGKINANVKGFTYKTKVNENTHHRYVNGAKVDGAGVNGFGIAFDFGATYKAARDWTVSASLLDLGFIGWSNNMLATTNGLKTFNTDGYTFNADDDQPNSFGKEWDKIKDDLSALYELDDMGDTGGKARMLGATFNIGAQYTLPAYRKLTFGLLNTTRIQGEYSWTDFRLSANVAPVKCFEAGVNMSAGTYGVGFGWLMNFHTKGFNFFLGMDRTLGKVTKQFVPLSSNGSVNIGMNFPL
ncbi:MAG: DUF5723 family protein [Muribaculaceae bacterium]|nr:DUF5723 family protein [Muribaculaceae bacterium]